MKLYPYQKEYYSRGNNFDITNKSRQIGFTSGCYAPKAVKRALLGIDQLLVSSSQRQSNKLMSYCELYIDNILKKRGVKLIKDSATQKTFSNGKSIYCFPSKPETVRGFPGDVRLDEFALHKDDERILEALLPSISSNSKYQLSIGSTPLGCKNMFYDIFTNTNKYPDFLRNQINCWEAIKLGCNMNIEKIKRNFDEESFRQEFECEFIDETTSFFPYELLKSCVSEYDNIRGRSFMGVDIGRTNDRTGIAVSTEGKDAIYLSRLEILERKDFDTQKFYIKQIFQDNAISGAMQDKGSIGYQISEELEKELYNYKGVFTNQTNFMNDVVTFTKKLMEQGKFKFNEDRDLINDFHKVKKVVTINNNVSFRIERDKTGHGDRAVAVMLANYQFKDDNEPDIL